MTRSEKIDLLENFSTFLAANGYMDEDWRSEPPFAIDEFLRLTPSTVEPTAKDETPEKFLREAFGEECIKNSSKFIALMMEQGVPMLYPDSRQRTYIYKAMQAYASQERSKAIQECIDTLLKLDTKILFGGKVYMSDNIGELEKLKTKSI